VRPGVGALRERDGGRIRHRTDQTSGDEGDRRAAESAARHARADRARAHYSPALTTVRQQFDELGRRAVVAVLDDAEPGSRDVVPAPLVIRASTARLSAGG
jgi:hypothetical protein